ncbi:MAG TPA: tannase/feruloyl esterase family alpha/beta hydrolase [Acidobacteriaceae bacterium]
MTLPQSSFCLHAKYKSFWLLSLLFLAVSQLHAQTACEQLTGIRLANAKITSAALVPAMDLPSQPAPHAFPGAHVPEHCEVKAVATPTSDSEIHFELWLPPASAWNGKYLQVGSGGWGGVIAIHSMITPLNRGYATAATDDGHVADGTGKFTMGHPEKLIDFGYRAIHYTSLESRVIMNAFYAQPLKQAYFVGCSDGGREALMQAERFPEDFNGIVAGAPANHWTHQFSGFIWNERALFAKGESILPATKLELLQSAVLKQCDALDGVRDGIIDDPRKCHFDPSILLCKAGDNPDCLTGEQAEAVRKIYSGPKDSVTGEQIYPGFEPGMEAETSSWRVWLLNRVQADFGNSNFADAVYENPKWDWRTSSLHDDLELADKKEASIVNSYNPDLRTFRDHGGKLIVYQGWEDAAVAPRDAINFYNQVTEFLTQYPDPRASSSNGSIDGFYRLFMAPGVSHCTGGVGPSSFGNYALPTAGVPDDADHDVVLALDRWVISGEAPDYIIATQVLGRESEASGSAGPLMTRPLCPYPKFARYKGTGSTADAKNFECVTEKAVSKR